MKVLAGLVIVLIVAIALGSVSADVGPTPFPAPTNWPPYPPPKATPILPPSTPPPPPPYPGKETPTAVGVVSIGGQAVVTGGVDLLLALVGCAILFLVRKR